MCAQRPKFVISLTGTLLFLETDQIHVLTLVRCCTLSILLIFCLVVDRIQLAVTLWAEGMDIQLTEIIWSFASSVLANPVFICFVIFIEFNGTVLGSFTVFSKIGEVTTMVNAKIGWFEFRALGLILGPSSRLVELLLLQFESLTRFRTKFAQF